MATDRAARVTVYEASLILGVSQQWAGTILRRERVGRRGNMYDVAQVLALRDQRAAAPPNLRRGRKTRDQMMNRLLGAVAPGLARGPADLSSATASTGRRRRGSLRSEALTPSSPIPIHPLVNYER